MDTRYQPEGLSFDNKNTFNPNFNGADRGPYSPQNAQQQDRLPLVSSRLLNRPVLPQKANMAFLLVHVCPTAFLQVHAYRMALPQVLGQSHLWQTNK
jgi:hypothetical protein